MRKRGLYILSAVNRIKQEWKYAENHGNKKKDLCGQSPVVDTESALKVKKAADFVRNQPLLLVRVGRFELPAS